TPVPPAPVAGWGAADGATHPTRAPRATRVASNRTGRKWLTIIVLPVSYRARPRAVDLASIESRTFRRLYREDGWLVRRASPVRWLRPDRAPNGTKLLVTVRSGTARSLG